MSDPADDTDAIIKAALQEEESIKKQRKAAKASQAHSTKLTKKGKTLAELEDEEGGPIKESLVGMAHTKRAAKRKGRGIGDTDLINDVERVEEDLEIDEDDGIKIEAFNLKEEREHGYFDDDGNYVEKTNKTSDDDDDGGEADAWIHSEEAKAIDPETMKKIQERQNKKMDQQAQAAPLTAIQIARLQWQISKILDPGETVLRALQRLGGGSASQRHTVTKRAKHDPRQKGQQEQTPADKEKFNQLTEAASALLDAGEMEVYSRDKSYFKQAASVYIDDDDDDDSMEDVGVEKGSGEQGKESNFLSRGVAKSVYDDVNEADDMFADDDDNNDKIKAKNNDTNNNNKEEKEVVGVNYASWSIKDLRKYLIDNGVDVLNIVEKSELVDKAKSVVIVASSKPKDTTTASTSTTMQAPYGYSFDPGSGLWKSEETGMYWDQSSGAFYNTSDQKWYSYDAEKGWVEWKN